MSVNVSKIWMNSQGIQDGETIHRLCLDHTSRGAVCLLDEYCAATSVIIEHHAGAIVTPAGPLGFHTLL